MFQPTSDVVVHRFDQQVALFHNRTGRHALLSLGALSQLEDETDPMAPLVQRLDRLLMLDKPSSEQLGQLIVCRSRLLVWHGDPCQIWFPTPEYRTAGGHGYQALDLDSKASKVWQLINEARTAQGIADNLMIPVEEVLDIFRPWTSFERQLIQLRPRAPHPRDHGLSRLVRPPRPDNERPDHQFGDAGDTDLLHYHLHEINDGTTHFDNRETTVAHALAVPHPALGGQTYGARLFDRIRATSDLPTTPCVLEIGCGDGELCRDWNRQAEQQGYAPRYHRADLSPELLKTQRAAHPESFGVMADAVALPFADAAFDLVISNEVIADLKSAPYPISAGSTQLEAAIESRIQRYDLEFGTEPVLVNIGAWMMLEELARVLKPGGFGWVTEFGDLDKEPEQATQLDHPEISIHFGRLLQVARALGLEASCLSLGDFLLLDYQAQQLSRGSWEAIRALARAKAIHLPARAWTPSTLHTALPMALTGLRWVPMCDEGVGPLISRFVALVVQKPKMPAE